MAQLSYKKLNWLLVLLIGLVVFWWQQRPKNEVRLVFCDVGQGDATLVSYADKQLLVDGGPDSSVLSCLGKQIAFWDKEIELVVLTHAQADHLTGLIEVMKRYQVDKIAMSRVGSKAADYQELLKVIEEQGVERIELMAGEKVRLGKVELEVLWPEESQVLGWQEDDDVNLVSSVLWGKYGGFDWLLTGDIGETEERMLLDEVEDRGIEVLKVAHHGSKYSSSEAFVKAVKPDVAVIMVGENRFGHPTKEVLGRLTDVGAKVLRTDESGMIEIVSDGKSWYTRD